MMSAVKIAENIYWVGAVDWKVRSFHGHTYSTKRGTTYNSYLVVDDKITLVDGVHASFADEMLDNIRRIIDPSKIECIVANHVETDHSGAIPRLLELNPKAKVYGTAKCKEGLHRYYYVPMDFQVVKTGDELKLGQKTLKFIEAPMIHWPDSMFTYVVEDAILMPNDAFGQHFASSERFADEVDQCALWDEAAKYYANILWPLGSIIKRKIEEVVKMNIPVKVIAPSHGLIWRKDPMKIVEKYLEWASGKTRKKAIIAYETMWGATEKMAKKIAEGLADSGSEVKLYNVAETDITDVFTDMLDARGFIFGSSTHDNDMLPSMAAFMELYKGFKAKDRHAAVFGSYGWAGGAVKEIESVIAEAGGVTTLPSISVKYMPDEKELEACRQFGVDFASKL
ncbi:MAG: flavodoxin domain-containing protein [Endomicrobiales bacterium]|nr:flavodoxin domain-containing protein [Endomicrobiales bacterium]